MVAQLPQRLKSMFFESFFFTPLLICTFTDAPFEKIKKTLILAFEANSSTLRLPCVYIAFFRNFSPLCGNRVGEMDIPIIVQCLRFRVQISGDIFVLIGCCSIFAICGGQSRH